MSNLPQEQVKRGFPAPCIRCGDDSSVRVDLSDVSQFYCGACDVDFTIDDVQALIGPWQAALRWLLTAPHRDN